MDNSLSPHAQRVVDAHTKTGKVVQHWDIPGHREFLKLFNGADKIGGPPRNRAVKSTPNNQKKECIQQLDVHKDVQATRRWQQLEAADSRWPQVAAGWQQQAAAGRSWHQRFKPALIFTNRPKKTCN